MQVWNKGTFQIFEEQIKPISKAVLNFNPGTSDVEVLAAGGCLFQKLPVRSFDDHHHFSRLPVSASYIFIIGSMWFGIAITYIYSMLISFITKSRRLFKSITLCEVITNAAAVLTSLIILHTKPSVGEGRGRQERLRRILSSNPCDSVLPSFTSVVCSSASLPIPEGSLRASLSARLSPTLQTFPVTWRRSLPFSCFFRLYIRSIVWLSVRSLLRGYFSASFAKGLHISH